MRFIYIFRTILIFGSGLILMSCILQNNATQQPVILLTPSPLGNTPTSVSATSPLAEQPTQISTLTPFPTLSSEDALETFVNLIESDEECNLPCWLGVTPGQTEFDEVENIFSQFSAIASTKFSSQSAYIRVFLPDFETATHDIATEVSPGENGKVSHVLVRASTYHDKNGPLDFNNSEFQRLLQREFVSAIFTTHGPPERIFLDTTRLSADPATNYPFVLWIIYPQKGLLIRYAGYNAQVGENIRICPMQSRIEIKIWDSKELGYEEFMKNDEAGGISLGPQAIESVTDFDIQSFYETFKGGEIDTCFETPTSIWPHP